jgi:hypothetical protein
LISFVKIGVVSTKANIQSKLKNRGIPCMFVGYSEHHANDVYRMLNLETKSIIHSRDIIWMNVAYHDWIERKVSQKEEIGNEDDNVIAIRRLRRSRMVKIT